MTYKEETYVLDTLKEIQETIRSPEIKQLIKETHENNIMLRQRKIILPNTGNCGDVLQLHPERWKAEHHGNGCSGKESFTFAE